MILGQLYPTLILWLLLAPFSFLSSAQNPKGLVINEIAWMGTKAKSTDEWIELYNSSDIPLNINDWKLVAADGIPNINLHGNILAKGFFLLERTDDNTISNIKADLIYKGALENSGEDLKLIDKEGHIIDEVNCSEGWFAGKGKPDFKTMERVNPLVSGSQKENWKTNNKGVLALDAKNHPINGTPKSKNSVLTTANRENSTHITRETYKFGSNHQLEVQIPKNSHLPTYPFGIVINEILPSPKGSDAENEWIEILNRNNFTADVSRWKIKDTVGTISTYTIPEGTKIKANDFLVLRRPETNITLQNSGDGLELLTPDGKIVSKVNYTKAPLGQSYNRTLSGWVWSTILTPGKTNIIPHLKTSKIKSSGTSKGKESRTVSPSSVNQLNKNRQALANISENFPKSPNSLTTFLVAVIIAVVSAIIVLILKKRLNGVELETKEK